MMPINIKEDCSKSSPIEKQKLPLWKYLSWVVNIIQKRIYTRISSLQTYIKGAEL